jgi:hypothetical protein
MANITPPFLALMRALDDAMIALERGRDDPDPSHRLPRRLYNRLTAIVDELDTIQRTLEETPEEVIRETEAEQLRATVDDREREAS